MKKIFLRILTVTLVLIVAMSSSSSVFAISYDKVADSSDMAAVDEVGVEGMKPIKGKDIKDGVYDVTVESSSSMFNVEKARLTVKNGKMEAVMTMGGTGYLKIFLGTGKEAAAADVSQYIDFEVDKNGKHTFTIPVEALDKAIPCAAFSKNREQWYDRSILFEAKSLPEGAVLVELPDYDALEKAAREKRIQAMKDEKDESSGPKPVGINLKDGTYRVEVDLEGGTGRASITSPAPLIVRDGKTYAQIQWSSSNYDYMIVGSTKYLPIEGKENATFEIPITVFDKKMNVIADTTAMSTPHEIEYTLFFHSDAISTAPSTESSKVVPLFMIVILVAAVMPMLLRKRK